MNWHLWNQVKPDFCKPLVLYWINAIGEGSFIEGYYDPRESLVELDGTEHFTVEDGTRWIYKGELVEFLSKFWDN